MPPPGHSHPQPPYAQPHPGAPGPEPAGGHPGAAGTPSAPDAGSPQWRRVHKITPLLNAWQVIAALLVVLTFQSLEFLGELWENRSRIDGGLVALIILGVVLLIALLAAGYSILAWRFTRFAVTADAVLLHQGIVFRQQRHARLNRIQAIDVVQPLLARLLGLAQLKVETAGGSSGSSVVLRYLKESEARAVRQEILHRAAASAAPVAGGTDGSGEGSGGASRPAGTGTPAPLPAAIDRPERVLYRVSVGQLFGSTLLSGWLFGALVFLGGTIVLAFVADPAVLVANVGAFVGVLALAWNRFNSGFGFQAGVTVDGIKLRHGLLEKRSQTVPPGRIYAVTLTQPLLWRIAGWWRVDVNIAGYGAAIENANAANLAVLLPVGRRGDALTALWLVLPDLGVDDTPAVLDAALTGSGPGAGFITSPRRARWIDPFTWRRNALTITRRGMLMRTGRFVRRLTIVPHERSQSLGIDQGPIERSLRIANFRVDSVRGSIYPRARHLDEITALAVLQDQAERARTARGQESEEEWRRRVGVLEPQAAAYPAPSPLPPGYAGGAPPPPA